MQNIFEKLHDGAFVITPNNRLSAILQEDYFAHCQQTVIEKPGCFPYNSLIKNSYQSLQIQKPEIDWPLLLTSHQIEFIWRNILQAHTDFIFSESLLITIVSAWNHCMLWNVSVEDERFQYTPQTRQFRSWWLVFNQKLAELNAITEQQIVSLLLQYQFSPDAASFIWLCFDSFTPQQEQLQQHLSALHIQQEFVDLPKQSGQCFQYKAENMEDEFEQILQFLQAHLAKKTPSIGIVVPDIQLKAKRLQRYLSTQIPAESFNISLGLPLTEFPLAAHALAFLQISRDSISYQQAKLVLFSPYIAGGRDELLQRTQYMQDSQLLHTASLDFQDWLVDLKSSVPILAGLLETLEPYPDKASPTEWIMHFKKRLHALGYPGDYGLYSENYQCFNKWIALLESFGDLESLSVILTQNEALSLLKTMASKTIFQPQRTSTTIQILGLLEASGCRFNALWVSGLTDQCLPEKVRLSPFIPPEIQKEYSMPHSSPDRELALAKEIIQRFQYSCDTGIFSYAAFEGDKPELPCPLIQHLPTYEPVLEKSQSFTSPLVREEENWLLPLKEKEKISGGTRLLANQSQCPFKAFATHRLYAKPLPECMEDLDSKTRGELIHKVMETLWQTLENQEKLLSMSETALDANIRQAILHALKMLAPKALPMLVHELEIKRLERLVKASLDWDKQRPPFSILALEQPCSINLEGLEINMRLDRLDETTCGQKWIIDYKSTLPARKPWTEERIQEPQLLLYTLLDETIQTLLFMELKHGKMQVSGFSSEKMDIKGLDAPKDRSWKEYKDQWKLQLEILAKEFLQGHHPPAPLGTNICERCDFNNLCRFQTEIIT